MAAKNLVQRILSFHCDLLKKGNDVRGNVHNDLMVNKFAGIYDLDKVKGSTRNRKCKSANKMQYDDPTYLNQPAGDFLGTTFFSMFRKK